MKKILLLGLSASLFMAPLLAVVPQQSLFSWDFVHEPVPVDSKKLAAAELVISPEQKWSFSQKIIDLHNQGKLIQRNIIPLLESKNIPVNNITRHTASLIVAVATTASNMKKRIFGKGFVAIMEGESNLTAENVKELIDAYRKSSNNPNASCDKEMIIELLKDRKNVLVQEMGDKVKKLMLDDDDLAGPLFFCLSISLAFIVNIISEAKSVAGKVTPDELVKCCLFGGLVTAPFNLGAIYPVVTHHHAIRSREQEMNYIDEVIEKLKSLDIA